MPLHTYTFLKTMMSQCTSEGYQILTERLATVHEVDHIVFALLGIDLSSTNV